MPIVVSHDTGERGKKDAKRHREKLKEILRKKLPEIIGEETIITGNNRGKTVRIPVKSVQIPVFRPKSNKGGVGVGQGPGGIGDIPGNMPNDDEYLEAEVPLEELLEMMFEDLGLPNMQEKQIREIEIELGWKIKGVARAGPSVLVYQKKTANEGLKRFYHYLQGLISENGQDELLCFRALKQSQGILQDAQELLKHPELITDTSEEIVPFPIIGQDDMRYHKIEESTEQQSNAVLIAMMDVSGSMGDMKKYLARSLLFWLVEFLRHQYTKVEVRFIIHHTEAHQVDEHHFFHTHEGGGTQCYTAYQVAESLIESEFPPEAWNIYLWHFSDGEDWDANKTVEYAKKLLPKLNMLGYGEVQPDSDAGTKHMFGMLVNSAPSELWSALKTGMKLSEGGSRELAILEGTDIPFLGVLITEREHILPALKEFLRKDRWAK